MHLQDGLRSVREELRPEAPQPGQRADRREEAAGFRGSEELQVRGVRAHRFVRKRGAQQGALPETAGGDRERADQARGPGKRDRRGGEGVFGAAGQARRHAREEGEEPPVRGPRHPVTCVLGDARLEETYRRALGGERTALLLTDPPYCLLTRRRKSGALRDKRAGVKIDPETVVRFEDVRAYRKFTEEWLPKAAAHVDGPLVVWTNFLGKEPIRSVARALGYAEAGEFIWAKQGSQQKGNEQLLRVYETALVFTAKPLPPPRPGDDARVGSGAAGE